MELNQNIGMEVSRPLTKEYEIVVSVDDQQEPIVPDLVLTWKTPLLVVQKDVISMGSGQGIGGSTMTTSFRWQKCNLSLTILEYPKNLVTSSARAYHMRLMNPKPAPQPDKDVWGRKIEQKKTNPGYEAIWKLPTSWGDAR